MQSLLQIGPLQSTWSPKVCKTTAFLGCLQGFCAIVLHTFGVQVVASGPHVAQAGAQKSPNAASDELSCCTQGLVGVVVTLNHQRTIARRSPSGSAQPSLGRLLATSRLLCSSFLVMTCFLIRGDNILNKTELHRSLQVVGSEEMPFHWPYHVGFAEC